MRALAPLLAVALATLALAQTQAPAQPTPANGAAAEAPAAAPPEPGVSPGAPSESELAPKPESAEEGVDLPEGFVAVPNPAFPRPRPAAPVAQRGRRYTAEDFAPYFAEGVLKEAKAAFDRGQYAHARRLLDGVGEPSPPVRYLRALAALGGGQDAVAGPERLALAEA